MVYVPPTPEELVVRIKEQQEKCRILHEARREAWFTVRDADAQHEFLQQACRAADNHYNDLRSSLTRACERIALEILQ